jgi:hypothetical protein
MCPLIGDGLLAAASNSDEHTTPSAAAPRPPRTVVARRSCGGRWRPGQAAAGRWRAGRAATYQWSKRIMEGWATASRGGLGQASGGGEGPARHRLPGSNAAAHQGDGERCVRPTAPVGVRAAAPEKAARGKRRRWRVVGAGGGMEIFRAAPRFGS